jgi:hypothetical protein
MAAPKRFRRARTRRNSEAVKVRLARRARKAAQRAGHDEGHGGEKPKGVLGKLASRIGKLFHKSNKTEEGRQGT